MFDENLKTKSLNRKDRQWLEARVKLLKDMSKGREEL
tara:strand:+ start:521 stop:631 length:111 start_codon:yes stop_codon:yes gene_type:complete